MDLHKVEHVPDSYDPELYEKLPPGSVLDLFNWADAMDAGISRALLHATLSGRDVPELVYGGEDDSPEADMD